MSKSGSNCKRVYYGTKKELIYDEQLYFTLQLVFIKFKTAFSCHFALPGERSMWKVGCWIKCVDATKNQKKKLLCGYRKLRKIRNDICMYVVESFVNGITYKL